MSYLNAATRPLTAQLHLRGGVEALVLGGTYTLTHKDSNFLNVDPTGNRTMVLPDVDSSDGLFFSIYNAADAAETITVTNAAAVTIVAIPQGGSAIVGCTGAAWKVTSSVGASAATAAANTWDLLQTYTVGARLVDTGAVQFGTPGTDLVLTADGTDVIVTGTGDLVFVDSCDLKIGTGKDIGIAWDGTRLNVTQAAVNSEIRWGVSGAGIDQIWYGDTVAADLTWDQSADTLLFGDAAKLAIGTGSDIVFSWDATRLNVTQALANSEIRWGVDGAGINQMWYGDTASSFLNWDQTGDSLVLGGTAKIRTQLITAATGTAIPVTHSGSFPITTAASETNTLADPTYIGQWISLFCDVYAVGNRVVTAASRINKAGTDRIMTFGSAGAYIKLEAIRIGGALKWQVVSNDGVTLT